MGSSGGAVFGGNPFAGSPGTFPASGVTTPGSIFSLVRSLLVGNPNDTSIFSDAALQPYFNLAYPELFQAMEMVQTPRVRREFYYLVPAYTSYLQPLAINVVDMDEPEMVQERISAGSIAIASTGADSPIIVTTQVPHNLGPNADIAIGSVIGTDSPWGRWFVTPIDSLRFSLNGSVSDGNPGQGGAIYLSGNQFCLMAPLSEMTDRPLSSQLLDYLWEDSVFKLRGATSPVQICVTYWANGNPPQNPATALNIEGCTPYLTYRIAGLAAESKGWFQVADRHEVRALGKGREPNASGGLLYNYLQVQVLSNQATPYRKLPFRDNISYEYFGDYPYGNFTATGRSPNSGTGVIHREAWYQIPVWNGFAQPDFSQGNVQAIMLTQDVTILNPVGYGVVWNLVLEQDATGGHAVTFGSRFIDVDPSGFSGPGVGGFTRVVIQFGIKPDNSIVYLGVIYGPSPYSPPTGILFDSAPGLFDDAGGLFDSH